MVQIPQLAPGETKGQKDGLKQQNKLRAFISNELVHILSCSWALAQAWSPTTTAVSLIVFF